MITDEFEAIYRSHADNLYRYCLYYLKDVEKAKDITQQAFFDYYKYYETVTSDTVFRCLVCEAKELLSNSQHQGLERREALEWQMKIGRNLLRKKWRKAWMKSWLR